MKGEYIKLTNFIRGVHKFIIPLYQRNYEWTLDNCRILYEDLLELKNENRKKHFIGSIVSKKEIESENNIILIDGQQRIITIFLIYLAMYNLIKEEEIETSINAEEIKEEFLLYKFSKEKNKYKIASTEKDSKDINSLINNNIDLNQKIDSNIIENYKFFYNELKNKRISIDDLYREISKLGIISITLDYDENPQLIFESLNSTGLPLKNSDKIRNFLLMQINTEEEQENIYTQYWKKIENILNKDFDKFINHYLIFKNKLHATSKNVKKRSSYESFKRFFFSGDFTGYLYVLKDMHYYAELYGDILHFTVNNDKINKYLKHFYFMSKDKIRPFLLFLLDMYQFKEISEKVIISIFEILESYLLRRFVCKREFSTFLFTTIQKDMLKNEEKDYFLSFKKSFFPKVFSKIEYKFPDDNEFEESFKKYQMNNFSTNEKRRQLFYILAKIESFKCKESIDLFDNKKQFLQIEHIMPQKLSPEWITDLGENYKKIYTTFVNNIGNLTLTGYNQELSNKSFAFKRNIYAESSLKINQILSQNQKFGIDEIKKRIDFLFEKALQIWVYPEELLNQEYNI